ncbi:MAG: substrate-binding domain-containing protein [Parasporobacterium sp.]|nr:substrate-binding domain-containing protein [Parasporobacterium sp.]
MKKVIAIIISVCLLAMSAMALAACGESGGNEPAPAPAGSSAAPAGSSAAPAPTAGGHKVGFVTFGLGGDFFQQLADTFVAKLTEAGWDASYVDGKFDPTTQIEACENYIAQNVDVLVLWSVAPEAMGSVVESAQAKGIKVLAFVAPTEKYDLLMVSDDAELADNCNKLAAKWIDETFADAADGSVPVAVFTERDAETGVIQADELLKIQEYSKKAAAPMEVACTAEDMAEGQNKAENLYTTNPEIQVFLTAHSAIGRGINNFYTSESSPVKDLSKTGIFLINGDASIAELIKDSADNASPIRGMVLTGSVEDTANEILWGCEGLMDGTIDPGFVKKADTIFVDAATAQDYISTGKTSITPDDFK